MLLVGGDVGASAGEFDSAERIHCNLSCVGVVERSWVGGRFSLEAVVDGFYTISVDIVEAMILIVFASARKDKEAFVEG